MALHGDSCLDLDDDGILRENNQDTFMLDENGIVQGNDIYKQLMTQWTDSGLGTDKHSSSSTLKQLDLQSRHSNDDYFHFGDERGYSISDLEVSREDLGPEDSLAGSYGQDIDSYEADFTANRLSQSSDIQNVDDIYKAHHQQTFQYAYGNQFQNNVMFINDAEFSGQQNSLTEFESLDNYASHENLGQMLYENGPVDAFIYKTDEEFLNRNYRKADMNKSAPPNHCKGLRLQDLSLVPLLRAHSNSPSSVRTISSHSFPEVTPEEALIMYNNSLSSKEDRSEDSQQTDDELFLITGDIDFDSQKSLKSSVSQTPSMTPSPSRDEQATPAGEEVFHKEDKMLCNSGGSDEEQSLSEISLETLHSRPGSTGSQQSTFSEIPRVQKVELSGDSLHKSKSQESFFHEGLKQSKFHKKLSKRLLPKPKLAEMSTSFKIKSKSTANVSNQLRPMKPIHRSLFKLSKLQEDDQCSMSNETLGTSSEMALSAKLQEEFLIRKQATELVHQLQKDYDTLLAKYAMAEVTIDEMRLGSMRTPCPNQSDLKSGRASSLSLSMNEGIDALTPQFMASENFSLAPGQAVLHGNLSRIASLNSAENKVMCSTPGLPQTSDESTPLNTYAGVESVKISLMFQATSLAEQLESLKTLLEENHLTPEETKKAFDNIHEGQNKLRHDYLQAKEDHNLLKQSSKQVLSGERKFDADKELAGQLFQVEMRLDELQEEYSAEYQENQTYRQPYQSMDHTVLTGDDAQPDETAFDRKLSKLHNDYNALMSRYRRLKQMADSIEQEKEINNLVKKLKEICDKAPAFFKIIPEIQERLDKINPKIQLSGANNQLSARTPALSDTSPASSRIRTKKEHIDGLECGQNQPKERTPISNKQSSLCQNQEVPGSRLDGATRHPSYSGRCSPSSSSSSHLNPGQRCQPAFSSRSRPTEFYKKGGEASSTTSLQDSGISEQEQIGSGLHPTFQQQDKSGNPPKDDVDGSFTGSDINGVAATLHPNARGVWPFPTTNRSGISAVADDSTRQETTLFRNKKYSTSDRQTRKEKEGTPSRYRSVDEPMNKTTSESEVMGTKETDAISRRSRKLHKRTDEQPTSSSNRLQISRGSHGSVSSSKSAEPEGERRDILHTDSSCSWTSDDAVTIKVETRRAKKNNIQKMKISKTSENESVASKPRSQKGNGQKYHHNASEANPEIPTPLPKTNREKLEALHQELEELKKNFRSKKILQESCTANTCPAATADYYSSRQPFESYPLQRANSFSDSPVWRHDFCGTPSLQNTRQHDDIPVGWDAAAIQSERGSVSDSIKTCECSRREQHRNSRKNRILEWTRNRNYSYEQNGYESDQSMITSSLSQNNGCRPMKVVDYHVPKKLHRDITQLLPPKRDLTSSGARAFPRIRSASLPRSLGQTKQPKINNSSTTNSQQESHYIENPDLKYQTLKNPILDENGRSIPNVNSNGYSRAKDGQVPASQGLVHLIQPTHVNQTRVLSPVRTQISNYETCEDYIPAYPGISKASCSHLYPNMYKTEQSAAHFVQQPVCPHCGNNSGHDHENYHNNLPAMSGPSKSRASLICSTEGARSKRRSRSMSRTASHAPARRRYYRLADTEESAPSKDEITPNYRRSQSLSRSCTSQNHSENAFADQEVQSDLNSSLDMANRTVEDIGKLTKKMIRTVKGELVRSQWKRDFGSSYL